MSAAVEWRAGEPAVQRWVAAWLADPQAASARAVHAGARRRLHRLEAPEGGAAWMVKRHGRGPPHRLREAVKRALGRSPGRREWRALCRLHAAGVPVPEPLAWGRGAGGEEILVCAWRDGVPLREALEQRSEVERDALLRSLARSVSALHAAGLRHGDLHHGNLLVERDRVTLLDVQRARPLRGERDRLDDLARLELSLLRLGLAAPHRLGLRRWLEVEDAALDRALRRVARDFVRGRSRRELRVGRRFRRVRLDRRRGLRDASLEEEALRHCLEAFEAAPDAQSRRGGRTLVAPVCLEGRRLFVKRSDAGTFARALGRSLRGSPAARAFRTGHAVRFLGDVAPRPLAFLEERRRGLSRRCWLVLETVGERNAEDLASLPVPDRRACALALGSWLAECHALGLSHRDLKASNVRLQIEGAAPRFWWVDLEDVRLVRGLRDDRRVRSLAQLNASLGEQVLDDVSRRAAFDAYAARLPFAHPKDRVLGDIVEQSLARAHRWSGGSCPRAVAPGSSP